MLLIVEGDELAVAFDLLKLRLQFVRWDAPQSIASCFINLVLVLPGEFFFRRAAHSVGISTRTSIGDQSLLLSTSAATLMQYSPFNPARLSFTGCPADT